MTVPLDEQIRCVKREIAMRERVYPRWVQDGKMGPAKADQELTSMRAVLETLTELARDRKLPGLGALLHGDP